MIAVIGGGPSGMMAAYSAKKHYPAKRVVLYERNNVLGKKLRLTGGGRCNVSANVTNEEIVRCIVKNGRFLYSSLSQFGPQEIISFFAEYGVELKEEDHHRLFPVTNKSQDIVDGLRSGLEAVGVELCLGVDVQEVHPKHIVVGGKRIACEHIILATGGKTLPQTGSDGVGYGFAEGLGHTVTPLLPQEVPLVSNDRFIQEKTLQGLSFRDVQVRVKSGQKTIATLTHDLVITHFGFSGPVALRASFYVQQCLEKGEGPVTLEIDFIPGFESLPESHPNLQKRFIDFVTTINNNSVDILKCFKVTVYATRGFSYAFVTNGGVNIKEINPKTMQSKIHPTISFCGELMDISAFTGGYNITASMSSGFTAGKYCGGV